MPELSQYEQLERERRTLQLRARHAARRAVARPATHEAVQISTQRIEARVGAVAQLLAHEAQVDRLGDAAWSGLGLGLGLGSGFGSDLGLGLGSGLGLG